MLAPKTRGSGQPVAVLGAGELVSHLYRSDDEPDNENYQFNVFRLDRKLAATHSFRPSDLRDFVKLCQVLAFTVADDGWISTELRKELIDLTNELDEITQRWSDEING